MKILIGQTGGLILPTKKSEKFPDFWPNFRFSDIVILPKILGYYFQKSCFASCTKKLDPIFLDLSKKKFEGSKFTDLSEKNWIWEILLLGSSPGVFCNQGWSHLARSFCLWMHSVWSVEVHPELFSRQDFHHNGVHIKRQKKGIWWQPWHSAVIFFLMWSENCLNSFKWLKVW